ncbi:hypothetical protein PN36_31420 [Candidatus Thiomargarita nelsonii]|uniref:Uncharacterized protein n=1 Tax=Candidatus Thiomargarita nelsonii TaxID=1003181 RepID=A0A0A6PAX7_9GAMM|nr:hypothetical protein PN36_31420 [Candidatus Thiomargarita nelsonii]
MATIALAPPLIASGPPGWVVFGILAVVTVGAVAIMNASKQADDDFADDEPSSTESCPEDKDSTSETTDKPKELPQNPDDLLDDGYEETTDPRTPEHIRRFRNPKTGDEVEFHKGKPGKPGWEGKDHWHRFNPNKTGKGDAMLDKNGNPVPKNSKPSHIKPST